ncbi:MAG: HEAT repeat domain-containing protein [Candidatus Thorarchaeota archaeon]
MAETRRLLLEFEIDEVGILARKDKKVRDALVKAFSDSSDVVRTRALMAAMDLADPTIVSDVVNSMTDEEDEVRIAAAQVIGWYRQPRTIPVLLRGLKDSSTWVRSHCAAGLSKLLHGPIWARIKSEDLDIIIGDFDAMSDTQIREFLSVLNLTTRSIDYFINWRDRGFDIDIDFSIVEEMDSRTILLEDKVAEYEERLDADRPREAVPVVTRSAEVEAILDELPDEVLESLPSEDLKRLTPETARELVDSLLESFEKKPKKKVKVRKVKRVKKVKKRSREDIIAKIPEEVRESLPKDTLDSLSMDELEALVSTVPATESKEEEIEPALPAGSKSMTKKQIIDELPRNVRDRHDDAKLKGMKKAELLELLASSLAEDADVKLTPEDEERLVRLTEKYGGAKAMILVAIPEEMLAGIPDDQLEEMDEETLKGLSRALEHK